jgi:magnesium transporter
LEVKTDISDRDWVDWALNDLAAGRIQALSNALSDMHPAEVADLLEAMPREQRSALWVAVPVEQAAEVLTYLHDEARVGIIEEMDDEELAAAAGRMDVEDLASVIEELPQDPKKTILQSLDQDQRDQLWTVLAYEEDSAGRLMSTEVACVRPDVSLAVVLRWLRRQPGLPPHTDALMVINPEGRFLGKLSLSGLLTGDPKALVSTVMAEDCDVVPVGTPEREVAALFDRRDLISVPIVGEQQQLLGRITIDDVVDIIREEADRVIMHRAGLDEDEDLFAPVMPSARRRALWLGVNLITVFAAAWVIGRFQAALDQIVALAVLMPVVASMGGIAGSQTLTLTIRGLALGQVARSNIHWLLRKELAIGALNGIVWALVVALVAYLWFGDPGIAWVIALAMLANLLAAALAGILVPISLHRLKIDPALSGTVVLTTVTDILGFLSFLGLASIMLL